MNKNMPLILLMIFLFAAILPINSLVYYWLWRGVFLATGTKAACTPREWVLVLTQGLIGKVGTTHQKGARENKEWYIYFAGERYFIRHM